MSAARPARGRRDVQGVSPSKLSEVPRLALRKPDAAAACGLSDESFDRYVRPYVPVVRLGSVTVWPVADLLAFLEERGQAPVDELGERAA